MYYTPLKQKETISHIAKSIDKAVDKILSENGIIWNLDIKQLFIHVNFLKICTYKMSADGDFICGNEMCDERDIILDQPINELLNSWKQDLIWVFVNNLQDLIDLTKEFTEFSELNQYIYEVLNSDKN